MWAAKTYSGIIKPFYRRFPSALWHSCQFLIHIRWSKERQLSLLWGLSLFVTKEKKEMSEALTKQSLTASEENDT